MKKVFIPIYLLSCACSSSIPQNDKIETTGNNGVKNIVKEQKTERLNDTLKKVAAFKKWIFKINNNNQNQIGYKIYTDDESIGVKGIYPDGEYVYITDVYHTNIKRIDIRTGEIRSSKSLSSLPADDAAIWLRDIAVFDSNLFVTDDRDSIYVFDMELKYRYSIPTWRGDKYFEKITQDSLLVFKSREQLKDLSFVYTSLLINKGTGAVKIQQSVPYNEYKKNSSKSFVQGIEYKTYIKEGKYYFQSQYGTIELKTPIPEIKEYGALNLNFNSSTLVYFNATPTEFTLYVYKY